MKKEELFQQILDGSNQMIQVSELDTFSMIYANAPARIYTNHADKPYRGERCYKYMMGLDEQCPFCPLRKMGHKPTLETEIDNGKQVFAVKTFITMVDGKKAFVEYAWDITDIRKAEKEYRSRISAMMVSVRDAEMVFHIDITADKTLAIAGVSYKVDNIPAGIDIENLINMVSKYVADEKKIEPFKETFNRNNLITINESGRSQIDFDVRALFNDGTIRPTRVSACLFINPTNNHLEAIIYGIDISDEVNVQNELRRANAEQATQLKEIKNLNKQLKTVLDNYKEADYDRRRDFLTGLRNRQDLFDLLQDVLSEKHENIKSMFMMDIDNFKKLNDKYGHTYGDECLIRIGAALKEYGKANNMNVYRYGGEELLGVYFGGPKDSETIAGELVQLIRDLRIERDDVETGYVTISLGYTDDNKRYEKMIDKADEAMYRAKNSGKNQYAGF